MQLQFQESTKTGAKPADLIFSTPTMCHAGGSQKMIVSSVHAQQPVWELCTWECLVQEQVIALGQTIDVSTWRNYGSGLNSYLSFSCMHNMPVELTPNTLSLFTIYMCHHIKLDSVDTYLLGICQQLEPYFPNVHKIRKL